MTYMPVLIAFANSLNLAEIMSDITPGLIWIQTVGLTMKAIIIRIQMKYQTTIFLWEN